MQTADYCREIETYLCQKNDGHLIRVVGPSFELVSGWAARGVPLKVAYRGIDRYFERYYRNGSRRRPVRIDFCEADVLDVFDQWRRAIGLVGPADPDEGQPSSGTGREARGPSLPAHLERVLLRLTSARATNRLDATFDEIVDCVALELETARSHVRGVRGAARQALIDRLAVLDDQLLAAARDTVDDTTRAALAREADEELAGFRSSMAPDAFLRARQAAIDRFVRERFGLPVISFV